MADFGRLPGAAPLHTMEPWRQRCLPGGKDYFVRAQLAGGVLHRVRVRAEGIGGELACYWPIDSDVCRPSAERAERRDGERAVQ